MENECPICFECVPTLVSCPRCAESHCVGCFHDTMATMLAYPMCLACPQRYDRPFLVNNGLYDAAYFRKLYVSLEQGKMARALQAVTYMESKQQTDLKHNVLSQAATLLLPLTTLPKVAAFSRWIKTELSAAIANHAFIGYCYNKATCRGLLTETHLCVVCKTQFCAVCHAPEVPGHICDETLKLINKDTKPCPKCHVLVFKIVGCDQMYCTLCDAVWSWASGKQLFGVKIHNPHYFEKKAKEERLKRDIMDIPSGVEITREVAQDKLIHRTPRAHVPGLMYVLDLTESQIPALNAKILAFETDLALQSEFIFEQALEIDFEAGAYRKHAQKEYDEHVLDLLVTLRDIGSAIYTEQDMYGRFGSLLLLLEKELTTLNRVFVPEVPFPSFLFET